MTGKAKILIVDDEAPVAVTMSFLLARAGCETEIATNKAKAMQMLQSSRFSLITLDVTMPDCSGFDLCAEIRQDPSLSHIPIVFVSGRSSLEDQQRGLDAGAADYITKPFGVEFVPRLLSHIRTAITESVTEW
jgi:two-component system phosphate regulon response regulator PhoB